MKGVKPRKSSSPSPGVIREGFLGEGVPEPGSEVGGSPGTEEAWSLGLFKWLKSTEFRFQGRKQGAQTSEG